MPREEQEKIYAEIDVDTVKVSTLAVLFSDGDREFWVPQSVMCEWPGEGDSGTALVEEWFAEKEGLI